MIHGQQNRTKKSSFLVKWVPSTVYQIDSKEWNWYPSEGVEIISEPVGSLSIEYCLLISIYYIWQCIKLIDFEYSLSNQFVAFGSSSGHIEIYKTDKLTKYHKCISHYFAITGLNFICTPISFLNKSSSQINTKLNSNPFILASASADKELLGHLVPVEGKWNNTHV